MPYEQALQFQIHSFDKHFEFFSSIKLELFRDK